MRRKEDVKETKSRHLPQSEATGLKARPAPNHDKKWESHCGPSKKDSTNARKFDFAPPKTKNTKSGGGGLDHPTKKKRNTSTARRIFVFTETREVFGVFQVCFPQRQATERKSQVIAKEEKTNETLE